MALDKFNRIHPESTNLLSEYVFDIADNQRLEGERLLFKAKKSLIRIKNSVFKFLSKV